MLKHLVVALALVTALSTDVSVTSDPPVMLMAQTLHAHDTPIEAPRAQHVDPRPGCDEVAVMTVCGLPYEAGPWCGQDGNRIQAIYLRHVSEPSSGYQAVVDDIERAVWTADETLNRSAQREGRTAHFRFLTNDPCELQIDHVTTRQAVSDGRSAIQAVRAAGYESRDDRTFMIFFGEAKGCGWATLYSDTQSDPARNLNNIRGHYVAISKQCVNHYVVAHELGHTMGAVLEGAPNRHDGTHCKDGRDVLCVSTPANSKCPELVFDCGRDDWFAFEPRSHYLRTHWNTRYSSWLLTS